MDRDVFAARFIAAAERARDFASGMVSETLPEAMTFRLLLNQSNDDIQPLRPGEVVFPRDRRRRRARALLSADARTVVDELWRDGRVPEWVDLAVADVRPTSTVLETLCCGRFTDDESLLYHHAEGRPPFHVTSPVLPPGYDGGRFSLHWMRRR
ncbi:hypothetical protein [Asanoa sp. NPDC050611]|uniref:hypothetical protein n=1 Tax=Asanoa sp. NPDC050611 TaxID=3157098 RepID=UPI0033ED032F